MAVSKDGKLYAWGNNSGGAILGLGQASSDVQLVTDPVEVPGLEHVRSVAMGAMHGLAICAT